LQLWRNKSPHKGRNFIHNCKINSILGGMGAVCAASPLSAGR